MPNPFDAVDPTSVPTNPFDAVGAPGVAANPFDIAVGEVTPTMVQPIDSTKESVYRNIMLNRRPVRLTQTPLTEEQKALALTQSMSAHKPAVPTSWGEYETTQLPHDLLAAPPKQSTVINPAITPDTTQRQLAGTGIKLNDYGVTQDVARSLYNLPKIIGEEIPRSWEGSRGMFLNQPVVDESGNPLEVTPEFEKNMQDSRDKWLEKALYDEEYLRSISPKSDEAKFIMAFAKMPFEIAKFAGAGPGAPLLMAFESAGNSYMDAALSQKGTEGERQAAAMFDGAVGMLLGSLPGGPEIKTVGGLILNKLGRGIVLGTVMHGSKGASTYIYDPESAKKILKNPVGYLESAIHMMAYEAVSIPGEYGRIMSKLKAENARDIDAKPPTPPSTPGEEKLPTVLTNKPEIRRKQGNELEAQSSTLEGLMVELEQAKANLAKEEARVTGKTKKRTRDVRVKNEQTHIDNITKAIAEITGKDENVAQPPIEPEPEMPSNWRLPEEPPVPEQPVGLRADADALAAQQRLVDILGERARTTKSKKAQKLYEAEAKKLEAMWAPKEGTPIQDLPMDELIRRIQAEKPTDPVAEATAPKVEPVVPAENPVEPVAPNTFTHPVGDGVGPRQIPGDVANLMGMEVGPAKRTLARTLGLNENATWPEITADITSKIGKLGASAKETAVKIMEKVKGISRKVADAIARELHDVFGGTRGGQRGAIGLDINTPNFKQKRIDYLKSERDKIHIEVGGLLQELRAEWKARNLGYLSSDKTQKFSDVTSKLGRYIGWEQAFNITDPRVIDLVNRFRSLSEKSKEASRAVVDAKQMPETTTSNVVSFGGVKTEDRVAAGLGRIMQKAAERDANEYQSLDHLERIMESGKSPYDVAKKFFEETYPKLTADQKKEFDRQWKHNFGADVEFATKDATSALGKPSGPHDWMDISKSKDYSEFSGDSMEFARSMETGERSILPRMNYLNEIHEIKTVAGEVTGGTPGAAVHEGTVMPPDVAQAMGLDPGPAIRTLKRSLGLDPKASWSEVNREVISKIGGIGASAKETAIKIMEKVKDISRQTADAIASHLHALVKEFGAVLGFETKWSPEEMATRKINQLGSIRIGSWDESVKSKIRKINEKFGNIKPKKLEKWMRDVDSVGMLIATEYPDMDYEPNRNYSSFKDNGDKHYKKSVDFSTLCSKRIELQATVEAIAKRLWSEQKKTLTRDNLVDIRNMMKSDGREVSCGPCYVDTGRLKASEYMKEFAEKYPDLGDKFFSFSGWDYIYENRPEVYKELRKRFGALGGKGLESRTDYRGEVLKLSQKYIDGANSRSGQRWQSWSDFEAVHALDAMQVTVDSAVRKLKGHAYTKEDNFVKHMGRTNLMINQSLIPPLDGPQLTPEGRPIWDPVEGMDPKLAFENRKTFDNSVGVVGIGSTPDQVRSILREPDIDYVIPYHKSGVGKEMRVKMGIGWTDFEGRQQEREWKPVNSRITPNERAVWTAMLKERGLVSGKFDKKNKSVDWSEHDGNLDKYIKACADKGVIPKFAEFLDEGQNFIKMLTDTRMFDGEGKRIVQKPLEPNFDMDFVNKMFEAYVPKSGEPWQPTVDKFFGTNEPTKKVSASDVEALNSGGPIDGKFSKTDPSLLHAGLDLTPQLEFLAEKVKRKLGMPEGSSHADLVQWVVQNVGEMGKSVRDTAIKILNKIPEMGRELANKIAEAWHKTGITFGELDRPETNGEVVSMMGLGPGARTKEQRQQAAKQAELDAVKKLAEVAPEPLKGPTVEKLAKTRPDLPAYAVRRAQDEQSELRKEIFYPGLSDSEISRAKKMTSEQRRAIFDLPSKEEAYAEFKKAQREGRFPTIEQLADKHSAPTNTKEADQLIRNTNKLDRAARNRATASLSVGMKQGVFPTPGAMLKIKPSGDVDNSGWIRAVEALYTGRGINTANGSKAVIRPMLNYDPVDAAASAWHEIGRVRDFLTQSPVRTMEALHTLIGSPVQSLTTWRANKGENGRTYGAMNPTNNHEVDIRIAEGAALGNSTYIRKHLNEQFQELGITDNRLEIEKKMSPTKEALADAVDKRKRAQEYYDTGSNKSDAMVALQQAKANEGVAQEANNKALMELAMDPGLSDARVTVIANELGMGRKIPDALNTIASKKELKAARILLDQMLEIKRAMEAEGMPVREFYGVPHLITLGLKRKTVRNLENAAEVQRELSLNPDDIRMSAREEQSQLTTPDLFGMLDDYIPRVSFLLAKKAVAAKWKAAASDIGAAGHTNLADKITRDMTYYTEGSKGQIEFVNTLTNFWSNYLVGFRTSTAIKHLPKFLLEIANSDVRDVARGIADYLKNASPSEKEALNSMVPIAKGSRYNANPDIGAGESPMDIPKTMAQKFANASHYPMQAVEGYLRSVTFRTDLLAAKAKGMTPQQALADVLLRKCLVNFETTDKPAIMRTSAGRMVFFLQQTVWKIAELNMRSAKDLAVATGRVPSSLLGGEGLSAFEKQRFAQATKTAMASGILFALGKATGTPIWDWVTETPAWVKVMTGWIKPSVRALANLAQGKNAKYKHNFAQELKGGTIGEIPVISQALKDSDKYGFGSKGFLVNNLPGAVKDLVVEPSKSQLKKWGKTTASREFAKVTGLYDVHAEEKMEEKMLENRAKSQKAASDAMAKRVKIPFKALTKSALGESKTPPKPSPGTNPYTTPK